MQNSFPLHAPSKILHWLLFAYVLILGLEAGGAAFTAAAVFPVWTASPEAVIGWTLDNPFYIEEGDFFMYASSTTFLLAVAVLIASWKTERDLRMWLRLSTICFLMVFVWSVAYFIPVQDVMKGDAGTKVPREELSAMLNNFVLLNYGRLLMIAVALVSALHGLGLSYQFRMKRATTVTMEHAMVD